MEAEGKAAERIGDVVVVEEDLEGRRTQGKDERSMWRKESAVIGALVFSPAWPRSSPAWPRFS